MSSLGVENDLVSLFFPPQSSSFQLSHVEQGQIGTCYYCTFPSQLPISSPLCIFGTTCHVLKPHIPETFGNTEFWTHLVIRFEVAAPSVNKTLTTAIGNSIKFFPYMLKFCLQYFTASFISK